jgi:DNA topoisomerase-1
MPAITQQPTSTLARRQRLRRSDCSGPGIRRIKRGRGFSYIQEDGERVSDPDELLRIRELAIPPAWRDVWICPDPVGHLQATGVDAAGRKQYLYHERWREQQDRKKFDRMADFARALPRLRRRISADLDGEELDQARVLACAVRLLDVGLFRIGSEQYADEDGGLGLATITKQNVTVHDGAVTFDYLGKGGIRRRQEIVDPGAGEVVKSLRRRRGGDEQLLAYRIGRRWRRVRSDEITDYLKLQIGDEFSAKDFRTWNATVLAAVALAADGRQATSKTARRRAINRAVGGVAEVLGNTPAVARRSYIDPRVFDRYLSGWTIGPALDRIGPLGGPDDGARRRLEQAVLELLDDYRHSPVVERIETEAARNEASSARRTGSM